MLMEGIIKIDGGDIISKPEMTLSQLQATKVGAGAQLARAGPGYLWATLSSLCIEGIKADVSISFHQTVFSDRIYCTYIRFYPSDVQFTKLRAGASASEYDKMTEFYLTWIKEKTGQSPPIQYTWGAIYGGYDSVAGCPFLRINYTG